MKNYEMHSILRNIFIPRQCFFMANCQFWGREYIFFPNFVDKIPSKSIHAMNFETNSRTLSSIFQDICRFSGTCIHIAIYMDIYMYACLVRIVSHRKLLSSKAYGFRNTLPVDLLTSNFTLLLNSVTRY